MSDARTQHALPTGFRLLWYEIQKVLGTGGFGITYLAHDTNLDKSVAVKEYLPTEFAIRMKDHTVRPLSEERALTFAWGRTRFLQEAQTLAKFKHPNIVHVNSLFEANNTGYMVMEYEEGESLEGVLRKRGTLDESEIAVILIPLLDGLEQVHQTGFLHRDIKPGNILVRKDGTPLLIDFGSARQSYGSYTHTLTTMVSPGYAPFEQYESEGKNQGPWTDIYALAATLYRAATGRNPVDAITRSAVLRNEPDPLPPIATIAKGGYSELFLAAVTWGLAFLGSDRPQSIAEWRGMFLGTLDATLVPTPAATVADTITATESAPTVLTQPSNASAQEKTVAMPVTSSSTRHWRRVGATVLLVALVGTGVYLSVDWRQYGSAVMETGPPAEKHSAGPLAEWETDPAADAPGRPAEAAVPSSAPVAGRVLYSTDFSADDGRWRIGSSNWGTVTLVDGKYRFTVGPRNSDGQMWRCAKGKILDDFVVSVEATPVKGPRHFSYGVLFRYGGSERYYDARVSGSRKFKLGIKEGARYRALVNWSPAQEISLVSANRIELKAIGPLLSLAVNNRELVTVKDGTWHTGQVCLFVWVEKNESVIVDFDNLTVRAVR